MGSRLFLDLTMVPSMSGNHFHMRPSSFLLTQSNETFSDGRTQMVGSGTQRVAYYTGYPQTVVQACIHLLSLQSLQHPILDQFLSILRTLPLELLGPRFSAVHSLSLSFPQLLACSLVWFQDVERTMSVRTLNHTRWFIKQLTCAHHLPSDGSPISTSTTRIVDGRLSNQTTIALCARPISPVTPHSLPRSASCEILRSIR